MSTADGIIPGKFAIRKKRMPGFITSHFIFAPVLLIISSHVCFAIYTGSFQIYQDWNDCISAQIQCNHTITGQWPTGATNLNAEVHNRFLKFYFSSVMKNVRCLQILICGDENPCVCLIKNYTNENVSSVINSSEEIMITEEIHNYLIEVYTWPQQNVKPLVIRKNVTIYDCSKWHAQFEYFYDGERIKVTFIKAPKMCEFKKYYLAIQHENKLIVEKVVEDRENSSTLTIVFSFPFCKNIYYIEIQNYLEPNEDCLDIKREKSYCSVTKSFKKMFVPRVPCHQDKNKTNYKTSTPEESNASTTLFIACGLFFLYLILQAVYILIYLQTKPKKKGIVLFADDHEAHIKAICSLVDYLKTCHLDIRFASCLLKHHNDNRFIILAEAMKSDFVLLITSFAFQRRMEAWNRQQDYIEFFKEKNSSILSKIFLKKILLQKNISICRFDHVAANCYWPKSCYSVPSCLEKMVRDLAGGSFNVSTLKYFFKKKLLLHKLDIAIMDAAYYEDTNSEWFYRKYFCPKVIVNEENSDIE